MLRRAWANVAEGEHGKGQRVQRPGRHGKSCPLHNLAKEVRARHELKRTTMRDLVPSLPWLTQVHQRVVRVPIHAHAHEEQRDTTQKAHIIDFLRLALSVAAEGTALQVAIERAEEK